MALADDFNENDGLISDDDLHELRDCVIGAAISEMARFRPNSVGYPCHVRLVGAEDRAQLAPLAESFIRVVMGNGSS